MGVLIYNRGDPIEIDDRALAHLQVVIIDKLRRGEHFALTLEDGRRVLTSWISPRTPIEFVYRGNRKPSLNHAWLEDLAGQAGISGVLTLVPEPAVARARLALRNDQQAARAVGRAKQPVEPIGVDLGHGIVEKWNARPCAGWTTAVLPSPLAIECHDIRKLSPAQLAHDDDLEVREQAVVELDDVPSYRRCPWRAGPPMRVGASVGLDGFEVHDAHAQSSSSLNGRAWIDADGLRLGDERARGVGLDELLGEMAVGHDRRVREPADHQLHAAEVAVGSDERDVDDVELPVCGRAPVRSA